MYIYNVSQAIYLQKLVVLPFMMLWIENISFFCKIVIPAFHAGDLMNETTTGLNLHM